MAISMHDSGVYISKMTTVVFRAIIIFYLNITKYPAEITLISYMAGNWQQRYQAITAAPVNIKHYLKYFNILRTAIQKVRLRTDFHV